MVVLRCWALCSCLARGVEAERGEEMGGWLGESRGWGACAQPPKAYKDWAVPEANREEVRKHGAWGWWAAYNWLPLPGGLPTDPQNMEIL